MRKINLIPVLLLILIFTFACNQKKASDNLLDEDGWVQLFNGKDLSDWTVKINGYDVNDNFGDTYRVEDGIIKVRYEQYDSLRNRFGHIFYKDQFSHYILRVEYRILGEQCPGAPGWAYKNSGIMVHGQTPETMDKIQEFPVSIEIQLLGSDSLVQRTNMNVCTPGTNIVINNHLTLDHCISSTSDFVYGEEWQVAEIEVRGNEIINHIFNGDTVMSYTNPQLDDRDISYAKLLEINNGDKMLSKGTISLQSEGHPCDFRKVEIKVLEE